MSMPPPSAATIDVRPSFFFTAFLMWLFPPRVVIDGGEPVKTKWRRGATFPVAPGRHSVEVYVPYLWWKEMGRSGTTVDVAPGALVTVAWRCPFSVFGKGRVTVS